MRWIIVLFFSMGFLWGSGDAYNRGELLYFTKGCTGCHGSSAEGGGGFPRLANKSKDYLAKKLRDFREGKTSSQKQQQMIPYAASLSDQEIADLTLFLQEHKEEASEGIAHDLFGGYGS